MDADRTAGRVPRPHVFAASGVDRAAERRRDAGWLAERRRDPASHVVPVWGSLSLVAGGAEPRAVLLPPAGVAGWGMGGPDPVLLGEHQGAACFAVDVPDAAAADALARRGEWVELRRWGAVLPPTEAALLAHARGMSYWHRRHRYCGECGAPTLAQEAGHRRACGAPPCGAEHFPRTDPAVIALVTHGDACLLGRQAAWPAGQYAALAGFVEPGESLEDAVAREVAEETGVRVDRVRYHSSQPWPFPASLMVGFTATARDRTLRIDALELEDARWFTRRQIRNGVSEGTLRLPPDFSIAHALIRGWLEGSG